MKIAITEGPNAGRELDVEGPTVVGRDPAAAQLVIDDPEASRRHASLEPSGTGVTVEDLGSTNGTFLNGERVTGAQEAGAGDEIRIGTSVLTVQSTAEVTRMAAIPEQPDADATAIGSPVPDAPEPEPEPEPVAEQPEPVGAGLPPDPPPPDHEPGPAAWEEPTETAPPPAPGGQPAAAPSGGPGAPPPPDFGAPPAPDYGTPPPPPGAGQGYGAPQQGYAQPPPQYGQPGGAMVAGGYGPTGSGMETRDSTQTWLLCALVPFYALIHLHRTNKELEAWSGGRINYNAGATMSAMILGGFAFGIPIFVAIASYMGRVRTAQQMAGLPPQANFWGFLGRNFLFGYGWKWLQDQFNEIAVRQPQGW